MSVASRRTPASTGPVLHSTTFRLGYADTDPAGILYYAAWFAWMERMQSEWFWLNDLRQDELSGRHGFWTVTGHTECDYLVAVGLFDQIRIDLRVGRIGRRSFDLSHTMARTSDEVVVARALISIVAVAPDGTSIDLPPLLRDHLAAWEQGHRLTPQES